MKRLAIFVLFFFFILESRSQTNLTVVYNEMFKIISFEKQKKTDDFNRKQYLYVNEDSVGFYSFGMQDPDKKNNTVGNKKDHHSLFSFPGLQRCLHENYWVKPYNLQEFKLPFFDWKMYTDTLRIAGYVCHVAVSDGIVAWYASEIPSSFGPLTYYGLPGLILMLEDHVNKRLYKAVSVKFESPKILLPALEINKCKDCESKLKEIETFFAH